MSILLSQDTPHKSYSEKRFRVDLRKDIATKTISSSRRSDETRFKDSEQLLLPSQEFLLPQSALRKAQRIKMVEPQPSVITPPRILKKPPPNLRPIHDMTPATQEFVVAARRFPTPIPTVVPMPIPTRSLEPREQLQSTTPSRAPNPATTIPPVSSSSEQTQATTVKEPVSKGADRLTAQQEEALLKQYLEEVAAKINAAKRYPRSARRKGWEGTVVIKLYILPTGEVEKALLVNKSEYNVLNEAALQTIEKAQPFPQFYEDLTLQSITVNVPIQFTFSKR